MKNEWEIAMGEYRVDVTAADIEFGVVSDTMSCPIARAVNRALDWDGAEIDGPKFYTRYLEAKVLGEEMRNQVEEFIAAFDAGAVVSPFQFTLLVEPREYDGD
jgi:hypothetical protein